MERDWVAIMIGLGVSLIASAATLTALAAVVGTVFGAIVEGQPVYLLITVVALGFTCIFGAAVKWAITAIREEW